MIIKISKAEDLKQELQNQGKVTSLNQPGHIAAIEDMNKQMQQVRREYQVKDRDSRKTAAHVVLNS